MNTRRTAPELVRSAGRYGLRFKSFTLVSEGNWTSEDADWNYKDVPHLNLVHSQADAIGVAIEDDIIATLNFQRIARIPMPIALANYVASDGSQVYYTTLLCFVLVVETRISEHPQSENGLGRAKVETTYHVGGPPVAIWLFPLLRRVLTANYRVLMSEDLPMREQRGRLRNAGYRFASDGRPRTFSETTDLTIANVIPPSPHEAKSVTVDLKLLTSEGTTMTVGEGPGGLRLVRGVGDEVMIFDRVCNHEGACLDSAMLSNGCLVCPWHAKRVKALGKVLLGVSSVQQLSIAPNYEIVFENGSLSITGLP